MKCDDTHEYFSASAELTELILKEDPHEIREGNRSARLIAKWYENAEVLDFQIDGVEIMGKLQKDQLIFVRMPQKRTQRTCYSETENGLFFNGKFLYHDTRDIVLF